MITADAQQLEPGGRVTLYELDASSFGADQLFFHQHLQSGVIWWQGQEYGPWPIKAEGFSRTGDQPPTPKLSVGNLDGRIAALCLMFDDLVGARIIRRQTLVKYLDGKNFPPLRNQARNSSFEVSPSANTAPTGWATEGTMPSGVVIRYVPSPLRGGGRAFRFEATATAAGQYIGLTMPNIFAEKAVIEPNTDFTLSTYLRGSAGCVLRMYVQWVDANNAILATTTLSDVTATGQWMRLSLTGRTTQPTAVRARLFVGRMFSVEAGAVALELDNTQFERGAVATEYQLTGVDVVRNQARNSSFEVSPTPTSVPTGWATETTMSAMSLKYVPSPLPGGGRALRLEATATAAGQYVGLAMPNTFDEKTEIEPNSDFTLSTNLRGSAGCVLRMYVQWVDASNVILATTTLSDVTATGQWMRLSLTGRTTQPTAVRARLFAGRMFSVAAGAVALELDNTQFERGAVATEYQLTGVDLEASRNPNADPNEHFQDEVWFIERKTSEDKETVEFELTTAIDLNGEQLPGRQIIAGVCGALIRGGYRGPYCGYTGPAVADANDVPTTDPSRDQCSGLVRGCKLRFGADKPLPYGGFPAAGLLRT